MFYLNQTNHTQAENVIRVLFYTKCLVVYTKRKQYSVHTKTTQLFVVWRNVAVVLHFLLLMYLKELSMRARYQSYFMPYLTRYRSRRRCPVKRAQNGTRFLLHHEHGFRSVRSTTWPPSSPIRKSCTTTWSWKWNIRPSGRLNREKYYKTNFAVMQFTARF